MTEKKSQNNIFYIAALYSTSTFCIFHFFAYGLDFVIALVSFLSPITPTSTH